jgi:hypothetical protein
MLSPERAGEPLEIFARGMSRKHTKGQLLAIPVKNFKNIKILITANSFKNY